MRKHFSTVAISPSTIKRWLLMPAIVLVAGILGYTSIHFSKAATQAVNLEAESGTIAGGAIKVNDAAASNGQSVKFANAVTSTPIDAPYLAHAITGGTSIAFVWQASFVPAKQYEVYRNDIKVATTTPGVGTLPEAANGRTYIDTNVTAGTSYTYKVRAIANDGSMSPFKTAAAVIQPQSGKTTPIPTITFDTSLGGSDLLSYLQNSIKPHLEIWYPKIADYLAYPDYTTRKTIKIVMDPSVPLANSSLAEGLIRFNPDWMRDNKSDAEGAIVHESTHTVEGWNDHNAQDFATEGIADWIRDWFTLERFHIPSPDAQLSQHYSEEGTMLEWAQTKYSPGLIHKINVQVHSVGSGFNVNFFTNLTGGRTPDQLYREAKAQFYGSNTPITGIGGQCIDIASGSLTAGAKIQLYSCNGLNPQRLMAKYKDGGLHGNTKKLFSIDAALLAGNTERCLDVAAFGMANGTRVQSWPCNNELNQEWRVGPNSSLINPNSGKCLSTNGDGSENGNQLIISDCTGSAGQHWNMQP